MTRSPWLRVYDMQLFALFRLGFPPAPDLQILNLATILTDCNILSVNGFRFYFTPLAGVLFAFPSRYFCTIGSYGVFSLGSWSTQIPTGFLVPRRTQVLHQRDISISCTGISPSTSGLPKPFHYQYVFSKLFGLRPCSPTTPVKTGLGSSDFARRYFRNLRGIAPLLDFFSRVT